MARTIRRGLPIASNTLRLPIVPKIAFRFCVKLVTHFEGGELPNYLSRHYDWEKASVLHQTAGDVIRNLTGRNLKRRPETDLRGRVWLNYVFSEQALPRKKVRDVIHADRSRSNLVEKWIDDSASPSRSSALRLEKTCPGGLWIFDLPLWPLLRDAPIDRSWLLQEMTRYTRVIGGMECWRFPADEGLTDRRELTFTLRWDTTRLVARNDVWGLIGTLFLMRLCEVIGDTEGHLHVSQDMVRSLPGAIRQPWFRPYAEQLIEAADHVRCRVLLSAVLFGVDRETLLRQADDPNHEPCRERRPRCEVSYRFAEVTDPVLPREVVSGPTKRKRKAKKMRAQSC